jgi:hypothetical protein
MVPSPPWEHHWTLVLYALMPRAHCQKRHQHHYARHSVAAKILRLHVEIERAVIGLSFTMAINTLRPALMSSTPPN